MDKLKMHSPDFTNENIEKLAELFPNCVTEIEGTSTKNTKGHEKKTIKLGIDFDLLRQELSADLVEGPRERYQLNWPGKREALLTANTPITKTLRPSREESVDFDTTENLFIEGDNLDALKLLQETYLGKVKMIYIDPPYNTGNDFVYDDDFSVDKDEYDLLSEQKDEEGGRLVANTESNGRFHSDWLDMIYPRVKLARNLLKDDGVIFISIDDNELNNLKILMDEIYGEHNFISIFIWEKRTNRENRKVVSSRHDYILAYTKNISGKQRILKQLPMTAKALANYTNPDDDERGPWKSDPATAQAGHGTKSQFYELTAPNGKIHQLESGRCWLYTKEVMEKAISDNKIWFGKKGTAVPRVKTYLEAKVRGLTPESILFSLDAATNEIAKNQLKNMFDGVSVFDTPKPVDLIKILLQLTTENDLILDFFAGSSATAHAVMQLNAEDGGKRQFTMAQLPEVIDEKSEAYKAGYSNIAEISKERIRRAGKKIKEENADKESIDQLDTGFRVLKIESSNMKDVYYAPDEIGQTDLDDQTDNIKQDRTAEDLLFQVLLDWGVDLSLPITQETIEDKTVYFVDGNALAACFEPNVTEALVKELAKREPLRAVFRDSGYSSDSTKINIEQIFKLVSPATEVKAI